VSRLACSLNPALPCAYLHTLQVLLNHLPDRHDHEYARYCRRTISVCTANGTRPETAYAALLLSAHLPPKLELAGGLSLSYPAYPALLARLVARPPSLPPERLAAQYHALVPFASEGTHAVFLHLAMSLAAVKSQEIAWLMISLKHASSNVARVKIYVRLGVRYLGTSNRAAGCEILGVVAGSAGEEGELGRLAAIAVYHLANADLDDGREVGEEDVARMVLAAAVLGVEEEEEAGSEGEGGEGGEKMRRSQSSPVIAGLSPRSPPPPLN
jgi:hypothetical protein